MESFIKKGKVLSDIVLISKIKTVCKQSHLKTATKNGLIFHSKKKLFLLNHKNIRKYLDHPVSLVLSQYDLLFYGVLKKIQPLGQKAFEISIGWTKNTPLYYRECVEDLLN